MRFQQHNVHSQTNLANNSSMLYSNEKPTEASSFYNSAQITTNLNNSIQNVYQSASNIPSNMRQQNSLNQGIKISRPVRAQSSKRDAYKQKQLFLEPIFNKDNSSYVNSNGQALEMIQERINQNKVEAASSSNNYINAAPDRKTSISSHKFGAQNRFNKSSSMSGYSQAGMLPEFNNRSKQFQPLRA